LEKKNYIILQKLFFLLGNELVTFIILKSRNLFLKKLKVVINGLPQLVVPILFGVEAIWSQLG